jgi:hypothetical protein
MRVDVVSPGRAQLDELEVGRLLIRRAASRSPTRETEYQDLDLMRLFRRRTELICSQGFRESESDESMSLFEVLLRGILA